MFCVLDDVMNVLSLNKAIYKRSAYLSLTIEVWAGVNFIGFEFSLMATVCDNWFLPILACETNPIVLFIFFESLVFGNIDILNDTLQPA